MFLSARLANLALCFLVSGATSLMLEVAWSKELSYLLGNSLHGVATVVAAFMAGLALGSALATRLERRISSPVRAYGLFQIAIGVFAAVSLPLFRGLEPALRELFRVVGVGSALGIGVRFTVVFGLLALPVLLMGMTLPLLTRGATAPGSPVERSGGLLYGANTIGACIGTLVAGYFLVPSLGLLRTSWVAAALDLATGVLALSIAAHSVRGARRAPAAGLARGDGEPPLPPAHPATRASFAWTTPQRTIAVLFAATGAVAMVYEVAWFRLLGLTLGPSVYAFSCMLSVYLAGIGIGSALAAPHLARRDGIRLFATLETAIALLGLAGLFLAGRLPQIHLAIQARLLPSLGTTGFALGQALVAMLLVFAPCLASGALFPAVVRAVTERGAEAPPAGTIGRLYFGNTVGSIIGSLLTGFVLVPSLGVWATLKLAGIASGLLGSAAFVVAAVERGAGRRPARAARWALAPAPALLALGFAAIAPRFDAVLWNRGLYRSAVTEDSAEVLRTTPGTLLFTREGQNASVAVFRVEGGASLYVSGKPDASTSRGDTSTQLLLGSLPVFLAPSPEDVLVIGYGSGMTVGAVLAHDTVHSVDVVELEPAVIDASPYFESINRRPLADPRCHLVVEDGRLHLEESAKQYDVITSEPSNPWMAGIANLFTIDFYREVKGHLRPHGLFAQWIQNYRISGEALQTILASLHAEFPHLLVFQVNLGDFMVLASNDPISIPWSEIDRRFAQPRVRETLAEIGIRGPLDLGFFLLVPEAESIRFANGGHRVNTDDNVWLEHRMPIELVESALRSNDDGEVGSQLAILGRGSRLRALDTLWPGWPLEAGLEAMTLFPNRAEPLVLDGDWLFDPWRDLREMGLDGACGELAARGRPALVARLRAWAQAGDSLRVFREQASRALVAARRDGSLSAEMLNRTLAVYELPIALTFAAAHAQAAGDLAAAERFYRRALRHPESDSYLDALMGLARLLRDRNEVEAAYALAREATERFPYYSAPFVLASKLAARRGDAENSRALLARGLFYNPGDTSLTDLLRAR